MKKGILLIMLAFACSAAYAQEGSVKDENCKIVVSEPSIDSSCEEETHTISVAAGKDGKGKWVIGSCPAWCHAVMDGDKLVLTVWANPDTVARSGEYVIRHIYGYNEYAEAYPIKQAAATAEVLAEREAKAAAEKAAKFTPDEVIYKSSGVETVAPAAPVVMPAPFMVRDTTVTEKSGSEEVHTVTALEAKDSKKHNLIILDGNYMFTGGEIYSQKAKVDFMRFKLWPGFTTAFIQASAYHAVPKGMSPEWLFRPTIAFLNGEQRIGGTIGNILGLNLLASYSWTPSLAFMEGALTDMKIDYVSGYDVFFGLEATTTIPIFNVNVKAGYMLSKNKANLHPLSGSGDFNRTPFEFNGFAVSLGFTLGDRFTRAPSSIKLF